MFLCTLLPRILERNALLEEDVSESGSSSSNRKQKASSVPTIPAKVSEVLCTKKKLCRMEKGGPKGSELITLAQFRL